MSVSIKLNGSGLDFTGNVTLFQATQIMAFIAQQGEASEAPIQLVKAPEPELLKGGGQTDVDGTPQGDLYDSPRTAINELVAKTIPQKIVAVAFYLGATSKNGVTVSFKDVLAEFSNAGEPTPTHFPREIKKAVAEGFIYCEDKSTFRLLNKTDSIPQNGFPKSKLRSSSPKAKGAPAEKLTARPGIADIPIETSLDGYKDYFQVTKRSDQILWIIKYAQKHSFPSLNRPEIAAICAQLGGVITSKIFSATNEPNIKGGYLTTIKSQMSLSAKGEKYIAQALKAE